MCHRGARLMCGIAGFVSPSPGSPVVLRAMIDALAHRGPDSTGLFRRGGVGVANRRLAIIDVDGSIQPMITADQSIVLTYNGEIYNFRDLRAELMARGHRFHTRGDTEVLLEAYRAWGPAMLARVDGMFAFAIWDATAQRLFAACDRLGIKPLYYAWNGTTLVFASEPKAILQHPAVSRDLDLDAISLYLERQYIPPPRSVYREIRKLPPAHSLELADNQLTVRCYWQPSYRDKLTLTDDDAVGTLEQLLRRAVSSMLVADVPHGAFLSGGVDSSLMTALMVKTSGQPVDTFSLGFVGAGRRSEHEEAAAVARHLGCRHHALQVTANDVRKELDHFIDVFDEPFGDQSALPTLLLSRLAREDVTVALTGEGADEIFAGYPSYIRRLRLHRVSERVAGRWSPIPAALRLLPGTIRAHHLGLRMMTRPRMERYASQSGQFLEEGHAALYTPAFYAARHETMRAYGARAWAECDGDEPLDKMLHIDTRLWLPANLLTKVDRAGMAYALEARLPYLDRAVVEFTARLDPEMKIRNGQTKYVLKQVAERYLPAPMVHRAKRGFVMPLGDWLTGEWQDLVRTTLSDAGLLRRGLLRPAPVKRLVRLHREFRVWTLIALELWFARYAPDFKLT